jgi:hypothetical protein
MAKTAVICALKVLDKQNRETSYGINTDHGERVNE